ncbi:MAG: MoxR family ATPase [Saprospirales bacterium]|jgi:MoxR-like ATPase|nr:MoxR family ATPase [Saprospirales bacterium]MBK8352998.1 MoxR family ATPase [Saprospirales bacterium]
MQEFKGTENYIATEELQIAVNAAIALEKPLLIKGEPGTGKTLLAFEIAKALGKDIHTWHVKSTTTAQQGLYEYDAVARLRDSQFGDDKTKDISHYIIKGKMWQAFESEEKSVLLIDEIDKADIEFPNDLLLELDKMEFYCYELQKTIKAKNRPIVIITSNNEKELPDAFLRRCFFHFIRFPERQTMIDIVKVHFPTIEDDLMEEAMKVFYGIREIHGIKKKPSTSELIDWIRLLKLGKNTKEDLEKIDFVAAQPPYYGSLLKNEQDFEHILKAKRAGQNTFRRF